MFLGGLHDNGKYENCTGGITNYIDRVIFTDKHLYQHPPCQLLYGRRKHFRDFEIYNRFYLGCKAPFDPENLLGAIPTMFLAYLGVQAGRILGLN
jgi:heparan-alpha-glucosaminide N-acetyltransferase